MNTRERFDLREMVRHSLRVHFEGHEEDPPDKLLPMALPMAAVQYLLTLLTEQQEPVGWIEEDELPVAGRATIHSEPNASRVRVYLTPQQDRDRQAMEALRNYGEMAWFLDEVTDRIVLTGLPCDKWAHDANDPTDTILASREADDE